MKKSELTQDIKGCFNYEECVVVYTNDTYVFTNTDSHETMFIENGLGGPTTCVEWLDKALSFMGKDTFAVFLHCELGQILMDQALDELWDGEFGELTEQEASNKLKEFRNLRKSASFIE